MKDALEKIVNIPQIHIRSKTEKQNQITHPIVKEKKKKKKKKQNKHFQFTYTTYT